MAEIISKAELAEQYVRKYLEIAQKNNTSYSKRFIATVLQAEHPNVFKSVEDARLYVRRVTGANGKSSKKSTEQLAEDFALLEMPIQELEIKDFIVPKQYKKALLINDWHSRFHDREATDTALNHAVKQGCDNVIINGDLIDFYQFSRYDKNPNILRYFHSERELVQDFLSLLQKHFGKVFFKSGNHEKRREDWLNKKLADNPEYDGLINLDDYVFFDGSTVEVIEDYNIVQFGKLNVMHGHEYYGGGMHIAYNRLNKAFDNVISGHSHVTQSSFKKTINGTFYGSWSVGCLCSLSPRYNPRNNWNHGFAIIERDASGEFIVHNKQIIGKKIF